jgi:superfamily II DNA/RNA helicase
LEAIERFALVGSDERIDERSAELRSAGVDIVVGYPARGPAALGR